MPPEKIGTMIIANEWFRHTFVQNWHIPSWKPHSSTHRIGNTSVVSGVTRAFPDVIFFFPYPFLDLEFFYLFLYFTLKIYQNLLFFQMRMRGESNPRPIIISQTTEPLDQRGMSCQTSDFNPWYTSSPFLFTDYPLYFFCLQFTAQTVIFDNVARDRYLTKDFNNGLGNEVRPNWKSRNTDSSSKLYLDISTIYHALMWHNSSAFLLPVMTFQKEFRLVTLIFKFLTDPE